MADAVLSSMFPGTASLSFLSNTTCRASVMSGVNKGTARLELAGFWSGLMFMGEGTFMLAARITYVRRPTCPILGSTFDVPG